MLKERSKVGRWFFVKRKTMHRKLERKTGTIFGYYFCPPHLRRGPLGLVMVAGMGPNTGPDQPWSESWRGARGLEVCVLGRSFYFEKVD